jgi:small conductance mechanosensitive channel
LKVFTKLNEISLGSISVGTLLQAVLVFAVCLAVMKIVSRLFGNLIGKTKIEKTLKGFIVSSLKIALWCLTAVIVAESLGIPTTSLIAMFSVAGLALSLSIQGLMSNLFSGITILTTKPFVSGDYAELGGVSGTVVDINFFYTKLLTVDKKIIYVPNSDVTSSKITNYSRETIRRVDLEYRASYNADTETVKKALMTAVSYHNDKIKDTPAPSVVLKNFGESNITYSLRVYCNNADYWDVYYALNEAVRESFNKYNIEMSYNNINVKIINKD